MDRFRDDSVNKMVNDCTTNWKLGIFLLFVYFNGV